MKLSVSAIIPFYNEEKSIGGVVDTLLASRFITEVICVNDGSTDGSVVALASRKANIKLIELKENQGKGAALAAGIVKAQSPFVLFCDADLLGLTVVHIDSMVRPILRGLCKVVFAVPADKKTGRYGRHMVFLTGQRVYPRAALVPHIKRLTGSKGAAIEIYLNTLFRKKEITIVPLPGLIAPPKEKKWSPTMALKQYLLSVIGVLQETGKIEIHSVRDFRQIENLFQVETVENLRETIRQIKDSNIRLMLENYYAKYLAKYVKKMKPPFFVT